MNKTILTIILGCIAGVLGGALGQSGAEVMVPGLLILGIVSDFKTAAGTVLLAILPPLSLLAIIVYWKRKQVQVMTSIILIVVYFFAAYVGAFITKDLSNSTLEYISSAYFFIIGSFFLWNAITGTYGNDGEKTKHLKTGSHKEGFRNLTNYVSNFFKKLK
jgi:uncharacterized membrane protein YfcA